MTHERDMVKQCIELLREIRAMKASELGPTVTQELDTVIQMLDEFSKAKPGEALPDRVVEKVMKVLARVALTIPWILRILGMLRE